jgi:hypothetical protein
MAIGNLIEPDFTEELVGFMIQHHLSICSFPGKPLFMLPLSAARENELGADVEIKAIKPLYLQFKKSNGYPDYSSSKILKDRKLLGQSNSPTVLFFGLRKLGAKQEVLQHNLLLNLRNKLRRGSIGDAMYVAPLFWDKKRYSWEIYNTAYWNWHYHSGPIQYSYNSLKIKYDATKKHARVNFASLPIFDGHICIPPHAAVKNDDPNHKYSYLQSGQEVCFHSPSIVELSVGLGQYIDGFANMQDGLDSNGGSRIEEAANLFQELNLLAFPQAEQTLATISGTSQSERTPSQLLLDNWAAFGEKLYDEYRISQFLLIEYKLK